MIQVRDRDSSAGMVRVADYLVERISAHGVHANRRGCINNERAEFYLHV